MSYLMEETEDSSQSQSTALHRTTYGTKELHRNFGRTPADKLRTAADSSTLHRTYPINFSQERGGRRGRDPGGGYHIPILHATKIVSVGECLRMSVGTRHNSLAMTLKTSVNRHRLAGGKWEGRGGGVKWIRRRDTNIQIHIHIPPQCGE